MEDTTNKSLVSLLRNSVLLRVTDSELVIGYKNLKLFSAKKRLEIEKAAKAFFNPNISVFYEESDHGLDDSVREKIEQDRIKQEEEKKQKATEFHKVKEILNMFPGSKIKSIRVLEEKKDD